MKRYWKAFVRRLPILWGTRRMVVPIPRLGIVIKVVRLRIQDVREFLEDVDTWGGMMWDNPDPEVRALFWETVGLSFRRHLEGAVGGIADNWRERNFYKHADDATRQLLKPTTFSFLGLLNIQHLGCPTTDWAVCRAFRVIAKSELNRDGHHWDTPSNFDLSSGRPLLLDYGSKSTQKIIKQFGTRFLTEFDLEAGRAQEARERAYFDAHAKD